MAPSLTSAFGSAIEIITRRKMNSKTEIDCPAEGELWLLRFCGLEIYRIKTAEWNLYKDQEDGRLNLWLSLHCDEAIKQFEDTAYTNAVPSWEINILEPTIELAKGLKCAVPEGYDESRGGWITNFYANSHDGSDKNTVEIVECDGDRILFRLTGEVVDPNFYDDSKPRSRLSVLSWFAKNNRGSRSMQ